MHADREPNFPDSQERNPTHQSEAASHGRTVNGFTRVLKVYCPKQNTENDCRGPETYSRRERGLHIAAEREFFEDANQNEPDPVKDSVFNCFRTGDGKTVERKAVE